MEAGGFTLLAGDASVDSYSTSLACLFSNWIFAKNSACFVLIAAQLWHQPPTLPLYYEGKMMKTIFPQNYVYVLRTTTTRKFHQFFHQFLSPFSSIFSDLNFTLCSLYLPMLCHMSHTVSLGYL